MSEYKDEVLVVGKQNNPENLSQEQSGGSLIGQSRLANYGLITISIVVLLAGIYFARGVLTPLFIAAFFAVILFSPYSFMREKLRFSRIVAVLVLTVGVLLAGAVIVMILSTQLRQFSNNLPGYWKAFSATMESHNIDPDELMEFIPFIEKRKPESDTESEYASVTHVAQNVSSRAMEQASSVFASELSSEPAETADPQENLPATASTLPVEANPSDEIGGADILPPANLSEAPGKVLRVSMSQLYMYMREYIGKLMSFASTIFLVVLLLLFMFVEVTGLPRKVEAAIGVQENERVRSVLALIRNYMTIKTFVSFLVGSLVTLFLGLMDVQYWALWGVIAFFFNFIPNIGSVVAAIPPIIIATADKGLVPGIIVAILFIVVNCGIGYGLEPFLLGDGLDVSPLVVLISLIMWGSLLGPTGMFLSPPLAVICKIILLQFEETKWIAILMANRIPQEKTMSPSEAPTE